MERNFFEHLSLLGVVTLLLLATMITFIGAPSEADVREDRGISMEIEREKGQDAIFLNDTETFTVRIMGRFEAEGDVFRAEDADNWTLKTESDMDATIDPEDQDSNVTNEFDVEVTIHEEGTGRITFTAYCTKGDSTRYSEKDYEVEAVEPESVSVTVDNPTYYELEDIEVKLYVNGRLMNTVTIESLEPEESRDLEIKWSSHNLDAGEHRLEIRTDYGFEGEEETLLSRTFYVEEDTNTALYGAIIAIAVGAALLVFFLYRRKKKRRRRPW